MPAKGRHFRRHALKRDDTDGMNGNRQRYACFLLALFLILAAERAIPHSHVDHHGIVQADFSQDHAASNDEEASEKLHSDHYRPSVLRIAYIPHFVFQPVIHDALQIKSIIDFFPAAFNILPKILNSILIRYCTFSVNAPPFQIEH